MPPPPGPKLPAEDELGLSLTKLAGAKVTLLVGGKSHGKPRLRLEIEMAGGKTVLRALPEEFFHKESGLVRLEDLAHWLHLELPSAVDAVRAIYPDYAQWVDADGLADKLGVASDSSVSELPTLVRREHERWVVKAHRDLPGTSRLPLGKVTLADKEQAALGTMPPASPISVDEEEGPGASVRDPGNAVQPSRQGCFWWVVGLMAVASVGLIGFLVLQTLRSDGTDPTSGAAATTPASPAPPEVVGDVGRGALPVAEYADAACTILGARLADSDTRFRSALSGASGANQDLATVYEELAAASAAFADALKATSKDLQEVPSPDVPGGVEAHDAAITSYAEAAVAVTTIAAATAAFEPTTATPAQASALTDSINQGLADLDAALGTDSSTALIDAAFQQSEVCAQL